MIDKRGKMQIAKTTKATDKFLPEFTSDMGSFQFQPRLKYFMWSGLFSTVSQNYIAGEASWLNDSSAFIFFCFVPNNFKCRSEFINLSIQGMIYFVCF